jgi:hypothetical protein
MKCAVTVAAVSDPKGLAPKKLRLILASWIARMYDTKLIATRAFWWRFC